MNLIQLTDPQLRPRVALVDGGRLCLLTNCEHVHQLATHAARTGAPLQEVVAASVSREAVDYEPIYEGVSDWRIRVPITHPFEPAKVLVSGTGLTHRRSAGSRNAMHSGADAPVTDSMRMYQWGEDGGRPGPGEVGVQPEWFYKGNGYSLRAHNEALFIPGYAEDGGEEAEVAGIYLIDGNGTPHRIGFAAGNEFSDHQMERRNYLYLAPSKLRTCSIGPEIAVGTSFEAVTGRCAIERNGEVVWSKAIATGEDNMCHSLANLEYHHFKYAQHRIPDTVHVHFFGADALSFSDGVGLCDGDVAVVDFPELGRPLRNSIRREPCLAATVKVL